MVIEFKRNNSAFKALSDMAKRNSYIDEEKVKIVEMPECCINAEEMAGAFEERINDFPSHVGTFSIYVVNEYGITCSQLVGSRDSLEKSIAEEMASILTRYKKRYAGPISAFLVRFIPEIDGKLSLEDSVTRIFNTC